MSLPVEKRRQWIKSRREQRKLTKYARLRRQFLRFCLLLSLLSIGVLAFNRLNCQLSENKNALEIHGNAVSSNEQICSALQSDILNIPIFSLNPSDLEQRIKKLSVVKYAFVRRYLLPAPSLKVEVLEEFPWATIYTPAASIHNLKTASLGEGAAIDSPESHSKPEFVLSESGRLISIADFPNVYQPELKIYVDNKEQIHLNESDIERWANWVAYISKQIQSPVLSVDMREAHNVKIETGRFLLVLGNPDSGLTKRLSRLASVLEVLANQHKEPTYVNLALNSNIPIKLAKKNEKSIVDEKVSRL